MFLSCLTPVRTQLSFQSHRQLFSRASAELRSEHTPERKFASTGSRTQNHQVMSPTWSLPSQRGRAVFVGNVLGSYPLTILTDDLCVTFHFSQHLTLYNTMTTFYSPEEIKLSKILWEKGENTGFQHFLLFPKCFLTCERRIY